MILDRICFIENFSGDLVLKDISFWIFRNNIFSHSENMIAFEDLRKKHKDIKAKNIEAKDKGQRTKDKGQKKRRLNF